MLFAQAATVQIIGQQVNQTSRKHLHQGLIACDYTLI